MCDKCANAHNRRNAIIQQGKEDVPPPVRCLIAPEFVGQCLPCIVTGARGKCSIRPVTFDEGAEATAGKGKGKARGQGKGKQRATAQEDDDDREEIDLGPDDDDDDDAKVGAKAPMRSDAVYRMIRQNASGGYALEKWAFDFGQTRDPRLKSGPPPVRREDLDRLRLRATAAGFVNRSGEFHGK